MEITLTFEVEHVDHSDFPVSAKYIGTVEGHPLDHLFAVDENGLLTILHPDGTYGYVNTPPLRVMWKGVQR